MSAPRWILSEALVIAAVIALGVSTLFTKIENGK
jgi:hypothetical protein